MTATDDGPVHPGSCDSSQRFGDEDDEVACAASCLPPEPRHGTWDLPPPEEGGATEVFRHTYDQPGTYTATFSYGAVCSSSPYRSQGEASVTVTVAPS